MNEFSTISSSINKLIEVWESKLSKLSADKVSNLRNSQNRSVKQIIGHMIDSATNNIHRIVHLQNQAGPLIYPNYATFGNNDKWIAIQKYQEEDWQTLIQLWKYLNIHYTYIIQFIEPDKLKNEWISGPDRNITLKEMVVDYLRHFELHLNEIDELIK